MEKIKIIYMPLCDIKPYRRNPRHNDEAVEAVAESIKEFGFKSPIVITADNTIINGHTRYKAAKRLKLEAVPCIRADDLTPEQVKAFRIADNATSELAEWDFELLNAEMISINDIDMRSFGLLADDDNNLLLDIGNEVPITYEEYKRQALNQEGGQMKKWKK